jgi:hypothetical protein
MFVLSLFFAGDAPQMMTSGHIRFLRCVFASGVQNDSTYLEPVKRSLTTCSSSLNRAVTLSIVGTSLAG